MTNDTFKQIYEHIQDGIIVMTEEREIKLINPAARKMTEWQVGDKVPFCSYCMSCAKKDETPSCYLMKNKEVPSFLSQMPTYQGKTIDVQMSTATIYMNGETGEQQYLLVLRDQALFEQAAKAATRQKMLQAMVEAKETEHKRLAQELHDGVGQSLYSISIALQAIDVFITGNEQLKSYVGEVRSELDKVMQDVNNYSHQLRPYIIDQLGLGEAIASLIEMVKKSHPSIQFKMTATPISRLSSTIEINIYRVIQEALHNITKYAHATQVDITLAERGNRLFVRIADNGVGFEREQLQSPGLGLLHMEERVEHLGGKCQIHAQHGKGTDIRIEVPL